MADVLEAMAEVLVSLFGDEGLTEGDRNAIRNILHAAEAEGWVLVPREPTEAMSDAAWDAMNCVHCDDGIRAAIEAGRLKMD